MTAGRRRLLGSGPATRTVGLAGAAIALQTVLLLGVGIAPGLVPPAADSAVLGLSVVGGALLARAARVRASEGSGWWSPDWRRWLPAMLPPGLNLGVWLGYVVRLREASTADRPTGRWRNPAVGAAVLAAVGTATVRAWSSEGSPGPLVVLVALAALVAVGFDVVAMYYDTRYVTRVVENAGSGWLFAGYHWVVLVPLVIPLNLVLVLLYLYRRQTLLSRAERGNWSIDELAAGKGPTGDPPAAASRDDQPGQDPRKNR